MATLNLTLTVPNDKAVEILNDFCHYHGYQDKILSPESSPGNEMWIDNPVSKGTFAKAKIAEFVKNSVKSKRANEAAESARTTAINEVEAIIIS